LSEEVPLKYVKVRGEKCFVKDNTLVLDEKKLTDVFEIEELEKLTDLKYLYLNKNQIRNLKGLEHLTNLQILSLSGNQITELKGLEQLIHLRELILSHNQIEKIEGLEYLVHLKRLDLSYNAIVEIEGLEYLVHLKQLDLWGNQITEIKGLDSLINLCELFLGDNQITEIKGLEYLKNLRRLQLAGNPVKKDERHLIWKHRQVVEYCRFKKEGEDELKNASFPVTLIEKPWIQVTVNIPLNNSGHIMGIGDINGISPDFVAKGPDETMIIYNSKKDLTENQINSLVFKILENIQKAIKKNKNYDRGEITRVVVHGSVELGNQRVLDVLAKIVSYLTEWPELFIEWQPSSLLTYFAEVIRAQRFEDNPDWTENMELTMEISNILDKLLQFIYSLLK
jgi:hypothetical protein